jgi:putative ABC transport system permease protein
MGDLWRDLRFGFRALVKNKAFTGVVVLTLALGIGANSLIFSVINTVLLRPLSYQDPDGLIVVWEHNVPRARDRNIVSPANFLQWRDQNKVFEQLAAFQDVRLNLTGVGDPEELPVQRITANLFPMLGVAASPGRNFTNDEDSPAAERVAILSHRLWQRRFNGDPQVIGKPLALNNESYTVVGIMPAEFEFFNPEIEVWVPLKFAADARNARGRSLNVLARLKPGITLEQARGDMTGIAARLAQEFPDRNKGWTVNLIPLREQFVGNFRLALLVLLGAVGCVLLIACANVANLLLARTAARRREISVRLALGATRGRIVRQLLTESLLLSFIGGGLGLLLAFVGGDLLAALLPKTMPHVQKIGINWPVLGFTLLISLLTGVIFGLAPAFYASKGDVNESLKDGVRGSTAGGGRRLRSVLLVFEVALALILLIGAGLLFKSFMKLQDVKPGFNPENVLTVRITLPQTGYAENDRQIAFFDQLLERVSALPGVQSAGTNSFLPLGGIATSTSFTIEGRPQPEGAEEPVADIRSISPKYLETMGITLLKGRGITAQDTEKSPKVAIINETMARRIFPNEDPLGKRVSLSWSSPMIGEIVGVAEDVREQGLDVPTRPMIYWSYPQFTSPTMNLVVRTTLEPSNLVASIRSEILRIDKNQPASRIVSMEQLLSESVAQPRFRTVLLALFAVVALILATVGIYSLISYGVAQRTGEIGVRMALGALPRDILKMVIGQGMLLVLIGIAIGLAAAYGMTRIMSSLLYGVEATDPVIFVSIATLLVVVALSACYLPARKALRVDPMEALRHQ